MWYESYGTITALTSNGRASRFVIAVKENTSKILVYNYPEKNLLHTFDGFNQIEYTKLAIS